MSKKFNQNIKPNEIQELSPIHSDIKKSQTKIYISENPNPKPPNPPEKEVLQKIKSPLNLDEFNKENNKNTLNIFKNINKLVSPLLISPVLGLHDKKLWTRDKKFTNKSLDIDNQIQ